MSKETKNKEVEENKIFRHEDDMSDAPDFLKQVVAVCKEHIEPLCEGKNKGIILIAVEDNVKEKDGSKSFATTFAVHGMPKALGRGLSRFMNNERSEAIVDNACRYARVETFVDEFKEFINDIKNL